jgi:hypothetical protein
MVTANRLLDGGADRTSGSLDHNLSTRLLPHLWNRSRSAGRAVIVDRHHLAYLNGIEKLNCILQLRERHFCLHAGNWGAHRAVLVPDPTCTARPSAPRLQGLRRLRRRGWHKRRLPMLREQLTSTDEGKDARSR